MRSRDLGGVVMLYCRYGWDANFVASAALVIGYRGRFEAIVSQIRAEFDLKASRSCG
jgi:hypothetical protein